MTDTSRVRPDKGASQADLSMYEICLLHSRADRNLRTLVSHSLERFGVTMMEWLLLAGVRNGPKEGLTMSDVAANLDVTLPQVTALSASLTKTKLLKSKVSTKDRRSRRLALTPAGQKLLDEVERSTDETFKELLSGIPSDQLDAYLKTVKSLAERNSR